ncbi:MAG: hypothetical protein WBG80_04580, partial [Bacteroidota bacterium]
ILAALDSPANLARRSVLACTAGRDGRDDFYNRRYSQSQVSRMNSRWKIAALVSLLFLPLLAASAEGEKGVKDSTQTGITELRAALEKMEQTHQKKMAELQARIEKLEKEKKKAAQQSELEKLLEEAEEVAAEERKKADDTETKVFTGGQRQQQSLNPNISATGDFIGALDASRGKQQLLIREVEFHIISNLDPYTRAKFFLGIPGLASLQIGEAYMEWLNFPRVGIKLGKYRTQFGIMNRYHEHGLPQIDRPRVLTTFLGEGLAGVGAGGNIFLPRLWSDVNELDLEIIYGGDGISFTNEGSKQWVGVMHLKNYYDLTSDSFLEIGLSGAYGHHDAEANHRTILGGLDLTYKWVPAGASKYRTVEFRNELFYSNRKQNGGTVNSLGLYSYLAYRLDIRWWTGLRFDYTQEPETGERHLWGLTPYFTFWQSEFVFIRLQYSYYRNFDGASENLFFLQVDWSVGPHKHEAY